MYLSKTVSRLAATAAVVASAAGASMAQQTFSYSTTFSPDPIPVPRPGQVLPEFMIDALQGNGINVLTPTTINLTNFRLMDNPADPNNNGTFTFSQAFTIGLTIDPAGLPGPMTRNITGTLSGSVTRQGSATATFNNVQFTPSGTGSLPITYDFGNGLTFTVSSPRYTSFGPVNSSTEGAIAVNVTSTAAIPEPSEYAAMAMAGFALCGLMVRARRSKSNGIKSGGMMAA